MGAAQRHPVNMETQYISQRYCMRDSKVKCLLKIENSSKLSDNTCNKLHGETSFNT